MDISTHMPDVDYDNMQVRVNKGNVRVNNLAFSVRLGVPLGLIFSPLYAQSLDFGELLDQSACLSE